MAAVAPMLVVVVLLVVVLVAPAGAAVYGKTVSVEKYAKSLCTAFTAWHKSLDGANTPAADLADPASGQKAVAAYLNGLITSTKTAIAKVKKAGIPDVDNGKQVAKSFQSYLSKATHEVSDALARVNAADPASPTFFATIAQVTASLSTIDTRLGDPFSKVESQDLLGAFKDEKACSGVVTIIGG
jgi:hypothetical protein